MRCYEGIRVTSDNDSSMIKIGMKKGTHGVIGSSPAKRVQKPCIRVIITLRLFDARRRSQFFYECDGNICIRCIPKVHLCEEQK